MVRVFRPAPPQTSVMLPTTFQWCAASGARGIAWRDGNSGHIGSSSARDTRRRPRSGWRERRSTRYSFNNDLTGETVARRPISTLVRTSRRPIRLNCWKIMAERARHLRNSRPFSAVTLTPSKDIRPDVGSARRLIIRSMVDLPAPERPITPTKLPGPTENEALSTAVLVPKRHVKPSPPACNAPDACRASWLAYGFNSYVTVRLRYGRCPPSMPAVTRPSSRCHQVN